MRKNIEKIMVEQEEVTYISGDGRVFVNENDCKEWEDSYRCVLQNTFNNMCKVKSDSVALGLPYNNDEHTVFIVVPKTEEDIIFLNAIEKSINGYANTTFEFNDINTKFILEFGWGYKDEFMFSSEWYSVYRFDKLKNELVAEYDRIENELSNKED